MTWQDLLVAKVVSFGEKKQMQFCHFGVDQMELGGRVSVSV